MISEPSAIIGFADSGAHIRNMAFYDYPLRMLKLVRDRHREGLPVLPIEKAVQRLTGEIGEWLGIDAGKLREGDRADLVVINPLALDERIGAYHEAPMEGLPSLSRMVSRSDGTCPLVVVNGVIAFEDGAFHSDLGKSPRFGRFLPGSQPRGPRITVPRSEPRAA